jgi:modification methylase
MQAAPAAAVNAPPAGRETPRIAFGTFVESGTLPAGTKLYDRQRRVVASVNADGSLISGAHRGSIHQVGAAVQNAPSCNGWIFWHFERDGRLLALDILRKELPGNNNNPIA